MSDKNQGVVKFFNPEKGFGFIKHDDSGKETFVHSSGLIDQVNEGDKVEFDLQEGKKGMNAVNVKKFRRASSNTTVHYKGLQLRVTSFNSNIFWSLNSFKYLI